MVGTVDNSEWMFQPKGGMCAACKWAAANCSELPFHEMPIIERDGPFATVRCIEFKKEVAE